MDTKKQRQHLREYTQAARQIELAGAAMGIIAGMHTRAARAALKALERGQQPLIRKLDKAAEKLGAPYGA